MTDYPSYNDYLNKWDENDKKAAEYIKTTKHHLIRSFYNEINCSKGELPNSVLASAYESSNVKIYPKHSPVIVNVCKEVEEFIQSKGFHYKLCKYETGFKYSHWPIRCVFDLKK